jgi:hypothetical protein
MKTKIVLTRLFLTMLVSTLIPFLVKAEIHQPKLQIPFTKTPPVIDGKLSDTAWQRNTELSEFVNWTLDSYIKDSVTVFLCYDEKNLYIAFRNSDPAAEDLNNTVKPKEPIDTFLWGRNHVKVGIGNKNVFLQLMADPKGTMTDWKNNDIKWNQAILRVYGN